jgi:hypothetical protein
MQVITPMEPLCRIGSPNSYPINCTFGFGCGQYVALFLSESDARRNLIAVQLLVQVQKRGDFSRYGVCPTCDSGSPAVVQIRPF